MRSRWIFVLCVACGGAEPIAQRSYLGHIEAAREHDARATEHERAASRAEGALGAQAYDCGDPVLDEQLAMASGGGLRSMRWQPCLDLEYQAEQRHLRAAQRERELARRERARAGALEEAERLACKGREARDAEQSVFADRSRIRRVDALHEEDGLAGVRVVIDPPPGMTVESLGRDLECQRARWALYGADDPDMLPANPALIEDARITVSARGDQLEVIVRTEDPASARIALARARGELVEQTARR